MRRYVRDAGDQLDRLHILTRADCTTRNQARAARLRSAYDDLERRIEVLAEQEELNALRPELDGNQIMELLGIPPGRDVGRAYHYLLERRIDEGPLGADRARGAAGLVGGRDPELVRRTVRSEPSYLRPVVAAPGRRTAGTQGAGRPAGPPRARSSPSARSSRRWRSEPQERASGGESGAVRGAVSDSVPLFMLRPRLATANQAATTR